MIKIIPNVKPLILASSIVLAACGGSSDDNNGGGSTAARTLSGTAAAGAALIGTVTVKGALGNTTSSIIEADGNYNVDVTGLTAPYRLRATGHVGGKTYKLHSYAEEADIGGNVNITPFTDLIVANAAQQIAESFFNETTDAGLDPAVIDAQEDALQAKLQNVLDALGVETAIDLLNSTFSADHSGLDAALDVISIEVDTGTNIATITNLIENSFISDDVLDDADSDVLQVSDPSAITGAVTDTQAIAALFENFAAEFVAGLPSSADIEDFLTADFLQNDSSRGLFLTDITTDPELIGLGFTGVSISDLDSTTGTASVTFNVVFEGKVDPESETWFVAKDTTLGWQLRGDQRIVDIDTLSFHCNDYDGEDLNPAGCGINVSFWDEDFTNNNTGGSPIASGTFRLLDGTTGLEKELVLLGNPGNVSAGEIQIYNASSNVNTDENFSGDWREFGTGVNQVDPASFVPGDIIEYKVYTDNLDLTDPLNPAITGTEVATYTDTVLYAPSEVPLLPTATTATLTGMENFTLGNDLTIAWTLADGTVSDEVLIEISDDIGNRIEIWDESFSGSTTSITVSSAEIDAAASEDSITLDPTAVSYTLHIRIYAADELTGQFHSVDYQRTIDGPNAGGSGGTGTSFTCSYQSGWDDNADGGLGAPINPNSFAEYEEVVADCGTAMSFTYNEVAGNSFLDIDETTTFSNTGSGTVQDPGTGNFDDGIDVIQFEWYLEDATCTNCNYTYLVVYSDDTIDVNLPTGAWFRETTALTGITGTPGVAGSTYSFVKYSEQFNYSDTDRATASDGEIWNAADVLQ